MKKIDLQTLKDKNKTELQKEAEVLKKQMAKIQLENKVNAPKNVNLISNMKKRLAVLLTIINSK
jgi:ribosomal protein L29